MAFSRDLPGLTAAGELGALLGGGWGRVLLSSRALATLARWWDLGPEATGNLSAIPASMTWWRQQCARAAARRTWDARSLHSRCGVRGAWGRVGSWAPGSLDDDSCAGPGDLTLRALPAKTCLPLPSLGTGRKTQIEHWVNVPWQDYGPKQELSSHQPGPRPWRVKVVPWALALSP